MINGMTLKLFKSIHNRNTIRESMKKIEEIKRMPKKVNAIFSLSATKCHPRLKVSIPQKPEI